MTATRITSAVTTAAVARWLYSIIELVLVLGIGRPSQSGQSGHPRPDCEARTIPPTETSAQAEAAAATAAVRKRDVVSTKAAASLARRHREGRDHPSVEPYAFLRIPNPGARRRAGDGLRAILRACPRTTALATRSLPSTTNYASSRGTTPPRR